MSAVDGRINSTLRYSCRSAHRAAKTLRSNAFGRGGCQAAPVRRACQHGFSLLELLVTLIVIVLITSLVSLTVTSGGQDVQLEAAVRNLADVAEYALDEAQMTGSDYGLRLDEEFGDDGPQFSYGWRERLLTGWSPLPEREDVFATRRLPPGIELQLELEDSVFSETDLAEEEDEGLPARSEREPPPQVVFYASGETTVGAINVRERESGDLLWRIEWDLLGRFKLLRRGENALEEDG